MVAGLSWREAIHTTRQADEEVLLISRGQRGLVQLECIVALCRRQCGISTGSSACTAPCCAAPCCATLSCVQHHIVHYYHHTAASLHSSITVWISTYRNLGVKSQQARCAAMVMEHCGACLRLVPRMGDRVAARGSQARKKVPKGVVGPSQSPRPTEQHIHALLQLFLTLTHVPLWHLAAV